MASSGERALAAELVVVLLAQTADAFAQAGPAGDTAKTGTWPSGKPSFWPQPARYVASVLAYLGLAGLAMFGDRAARLAMALGGVVALAILASPPNPSAPVGPGNESLILRALGWVTQLEQGGFTDGTRGQAVPITSQPVGPTATAALTAGVAPQATNGPTLSQQPSTHFPVQS